MSTIWGSQRKARCLPDTMGTASLQGIMSCGRSARRGDDTAALCLARSRCSSPGSRGMLHVPPILVLLRAGRPMEGAATSPALAADVPVEAASGTASGDGLARRQRQRLNLARYSYETCWEALGLVHGMGMQQTRCTSLGKKHGFLSKRASLFTCVSLQFSASDPPHMISMPPWIYLWTEDALDCYLRGWRDGPVVPGVIFGLSALPSCSSRALSHSTGVNQR